jgi:hypothetical protein
MSQIRIARLCSLLICSVAARRPKALCYASAHLQVAGGQAFYVESIPERE